MPAAMPGVMITAANKAQIRKSATSRAPSSPTHVVHKAKSNQLGRIFEESTGTELEGEIATRCEQRGSLVAGVCE